MPEKGAYDRSESSGQCNGSEEEKKHEGRSIGGRNACPNPRTLQGRKSELSNEKNEGSQTYMMIKSNSTDTTRRAMVSSGWFPPSFT